MAIPRVDDETLRVALLLGWEDIICDLRGQRDALKVHKLRRKVHSFVTLDNDIFLNNALILVAVRSASVHQVLEVVLGPAETERLRRAINGIGFEQAELLLLLRISEFVEELAVHEFLIFSEHRGQADHVLLEAVEVLEALELRADVSDGEIN